MPDETKTNQAIYTSDFKPTGVTDDPWAFDCVMISAGPSAASNYLYPQEWIDDPNTVAMYTGAQCYINHMSEEELVNRPEGDMKDLVGYWDHVTAKPGMMTGRIHIIPTKDNERIRDYCQAAIKYRSQFPDKNLFGVSIVQLGDWVMVDFQGKQYRKVINTKEVLSCDIVTKAGRGGMILNQAPLAVGANAEARRQWFAGYMAESMRVMQADMDKVQSESGASATGTAVLDRPGTQRLAESENASQLLQALTEMRDKVAAADDAMPLKKELRRGLDNALTLAQIGPAKAEGERTMGDSTKQELTTKPGMSVTVSHAHPPAGSTPPGAGADGTHTPGATDPEEEEATRCEEAANHFQKMAETEKEEESKRKYAGQAESFKKMAEAKRTKMAEAKKQREAEAEKEEESRRKQMSESEQEQESMRELLKGSLIKDSGLAETAQAYIRESTRGKSLGETKKAIEMAQALQREANPHLNPARQGGTGAGTSAAFEADFDRTFKGGRN